MRDESLRQLPGAVEFTQSFFRLAQAECGLPPAAYRRDRCPQRHCGLQDDAGADPGDGGSDMKFFVKIPRQKLHPVYNASKIRLNQQTADPHLLLA